MKGCSAGPAGLCERFLLVKERGLKREESVLVKQSTKQAQGQISLPLSPSLSLSLSLSLPIQTSSSCFHPTPPNPPCSASFYLFLLHPTHPACSIVWRMMVGWHQNGATGRETAHTPHGSDKQRESPSDFLLCCSSAPIYLSWYASAVHGSGLSL